MKPLIVTRWRLASIQVCTTLTNDREIERVTNMEHATGIESRWKMDRRPEVAPIQCAEHPDRMHYVLQC